MLLRELQKKNGMAILLITHDLGIVAQMAHRVAVMYAGQIVEIAERERFFTAPQHPYSRKLFEALPGSGKRGAELAVIKGQVPPLTAGIPPLPLRRPLRLRLRSLLSRGAGLDARSPPDTRSAASCASASARARPIPSMPARRRRPRRRNVLRRSSRCAI